MAVWLVRGGKHGEHEPRFFEDERVYLNWEELPQDLSTLKTWNAVKDELRVRYPDSSERRLGNWTGQVDAFLNQMQKGDLVVTPRKQSWGAVAIGEIVGAYAYAPNSDMPYRSFRPVKWLRPDFPRPQLDADLQNSIRALLTICRIQQPDAEARLRSYAKSGSATPPPPAPANPSAEAAPVDLERAGKDAIVRFIEQKFTGHEFASLIHALLVAQGYTTYLSPPGPDGGVDILAAPGALGFGSPTICVQVKSGKTPVDRPTLDQLIGVMQNYHATQGLLVSWGGFRDSVQRERSRQFFKVRLWGPDDVVQQILESYDRLSEDVRAELPLKRVWTVAQTEE